MPIVINDPAGSSYSTWIESTNPQTGDTEVSRVDDLTVVFATLVDTAAIVNDHFKIFSVSSGQEVEGAIRDISLGNDYEAFTKTLTLHLTAPLAASTSYILEIRGLFDPFGNPQDDVHSVVFTTTSAPGELAPDNSDTPIVVSDHTIADSDIGLFEQVSAGGAVVVYMDPIDGSYNVAKSTQTITLTYPAGVPDDITVTVHRRVVSAREIPWSVVGVTSTQNETSVTITLPQVSSGTYVEPGYEYWVSAGVGNGSFYFMGELDPMFTSVQSVLMLNPYNTSYEVARMIYVYSGYAISMSPKLVSTPDNKAAHDYAMYGTLWELAMASSTAGSITLGDLSVKQTEASSSAKWEELMNAAKARINPVAPVFGVRGSNNTSPHAARDWDAAGTTKRRIGKKS